MTLPLFPNLLNLSDSEKERAQRLHHEGLVVDLLFQGVGGAIFEAYAPPLQDELEARLDQRESIFERAAEAQFWPYELDLRGRSSLIREWLFASGLDCGTIGITVADELSGNDLAWEKRTRSLERLPWLRFATTVEQIRQAKREGAIALYRNCQPVGGAPSSLKAFDEAYGRGLRSFMLTYNGRNTIGSGCTEANDEGLTPFGREAVDHLNAIGIAVDLSHCGERTSLEAARRSRAPVTANHTAAKAVYDHARSKSDRVIEAIAATGGIIGVVAAPPFLTGSERPALDHMLDHIDHVASIAGWEHVAIGSDWPLQLPSFLLRDLEQALRAHGFREEDGLDLSKTLEGYEDVRGLGNVTRGLVKRGYNDEEIRGIIGENALRVFAASWRSEDSAAGRTTDAADG
jgi:membrane dipeptidase